MNQHNAACRDMLPSIAGRVWDHEWDRLPHSPGFRVRGLSQRPRGCRACCSDTPFLLPLAWRVAAALIVERPNDDGTEQDANTHGEPCQPVKMCLGLIWGLCEQ